MELKIKPSNLFLLLKFLQSRIVSVHRILIWSILSFMFSSPLVAQNSVLEIDPYMHHIRNSDLREWSNFPIIPENRELRIHFDAKKNAGEATLQIRQQNVKHSWQIYLNDSLLTNLHLNENDVTTYISIPEGFLKNGENMLLIKQSNQVPDDIRVGEIKLYSEPVKSLLNKSSVTIHVKDERTHQFLPSRITIVNENQSYQTVHVSSNRTLAVRPGVIYTGNGTAEFGLPPGNYTIYAGRGMEYGIDSTNVTIEHEHQRIEKTLTIEQQVDTKGYISSDTHIHTFTHSGHGDATEEERMLTIAGEGIDLPVTTEHNQHVNYSATASEMEMTEYFKTVVGNEVTTPLGHFNIFPVNENATIPDVQVETWNQLFNNIYATPGVEVVILNHGRDVHGGFTPLSRNNFHGGTGTFREGIDPQFNAMEVINSGAHRTDMMQLFRDWFAMTNRGYSVAPIGSSDSHDVTRYMLGQARTFIQSPAETPSNIHITGAAEQVVRGSVNVGMGLFTEIVVNNQYKPGDIAPIRDSIRVDITVQGPDWVEATVIDLYRNGEKIRSQKIDDNHAAGIKWKGSWTLNRFDHDSFLVAIARGPGVTAPYWPVARPYQPSSPQWNPEMIGATGAVWLDEDGNGIKNSAYDYAREVVETSGGSLEQLLDQLDTYDKAVAIQATGIIFDRYREILPLSYQLDKLLEVSSDHVREGFEAFINY